MIKFGIIIPFRPKTESIDWIRESNLLLQTIQSVLRQTYEAFDIFVVYTDAPDIHSDDTRVQYHEFPYGHQSYEEMENRDALLHRFKSAKMVVRRWDKARKLCYGSKLAKEAGCDYVMALDADDLLSNRFLSYMAKDAADNERRGWFVEVGYLYQKGSSYLIKVPKNMRFLNGSTHVLHHDLVKIPDFCSLDWQDYNLFTDHGWIKDRVHEIDGTQLQPIPFAALVYVVHRSNISQVEKKEYSFTLKSVIKRIIRGRILTSSLRMEFNIR